MHRVAGSLLAVLLVALGLAYSSGVLTEEDRRTHSCVLCRADRVSGKQYGFHYSRVTPSVFTPWYVEHLDPNHGKPGHPHDWRPSAPATSHRALRANARVTPRLVEPILLLRPELELAAIQRIPGMPAQLAFLNSLNTRSVPNAARRVRLLIEYFYILEPDVPWEKWWQANAHAFGVQVAARPSR